LQKHEGNIFSNQLFTVILQKAAKPSGNEKKGVMGLIFQKIFNKVG
jgi:hypothetical protein